MRNPFQSQPSELPLERRKHKQLATPLMAYDKPRHGPRTVKKSPVNQSMKLEGGTNKEMLANLLLNT
eukprot:CAMPEP_0170511996 /NCGR_PEP_ID=MMETSP0208-20121228/66609_1 /TAXON_ID=197538 /ORGANISM="Strombidium inclinatum, Strain S3" /LENGTH=66 /DNA_ID=CAMNT_0010795585 /DNA_START=685 /DNA_END=881 /DNA_ORIENTATION=-